MPDFANDTTESVKWLPGCQIWLNGCSLLKHRLGGIQKPLTHQDTRNAPTLNDFARPKLRVSAHMAFWDLSLSETSLQTVTSLENHVA